MNWRFARFDDLTPRDLHDILQARSAVFVVEQDCVFLDADGADPQCWHLWAALGDSPLVKGQSPNGVPNGVLAYCRLVPPGVKYAEPSIGRVITTEPARGTGLGREMMREAVRRTNELWPGPIRIGAQAHLEKFYGGFGFAKASDPYDEDGILHIEMLRP